MAFAIGIDLGTSYTSVGVFRNDLFEAIPNEEGDFLIPSYVSFTDTERLIGERAKSQLALNPCSTVFNIQRLIGRKITEADMEEDMKNYSFKIYDGFSEPYILVWYKGREKALTTLEITAMILRKMKDLAQNHLGVTVKDAVITCPSYWTVNQRLSIEDAAKIAGLNALRIVESPNCAAYAYDNYMKDKKKEKTVLFFDLGGGNTNLNITTFENNTIHIKSVTGNTHLGGEDFTNRLVSHFVEEFKHKYQKDVSSNARSLCRLRLACERAKSSLSFSTTSDLYIENFFDRIEFKSKITRSKFEELCEDLFSLALSLVGNVLADAHIDKYKVDEIVLLGGSSRIPKIQEMITQYFGGQKPVKPINLDLAPCFGAAVQAAIVLGDPSSKYIDRALLLGVQPLTLGVRLAGGRMSEIVPRNTAMPIQKAKRFAITKTNKNGQELCALPISIFEGESPWAKNNKLLAQIVPPNISLSSGGSSIEICIEHGMGLTGLTQLHVTVSDQDTGTLIIHVVINSGRLSKTKIEQMRAESEEYANDERTEAIRISTKTTLESRISFLKPTLENFRSLGWLQEFEIKKMEVEMDKILIWTDGNELASTSEYEVKREELAVIEKRAKGLLSNNQGPKATTKNL